LTPAPSGRGAGDPVDLARHDRLLVRVPASSANLGPGFDVLGAALALHLELEVLQTGTFRVLSDLDVPSDRTNLVVRAFERLAPADGFEFRISSQIPLSGGFGSSAAAILAGLSAADRLFELGAGVDRLAVELEGHPDNVAAAMQGGFVVCDGARAYRFEPPAGLEAVLVVPEQVVPTAQARAALPRSVPTAQARAALPRSVPMADAVFNVAHAAMLVLGLVHGDWDLIAAGLEDRLHQPWRAHLYPRSAALLARARSLGALGATISGAGPSVLVWCRREQTGALVQSLSGEAKGWARVIHVPFASEGAEVREV